MTCLMMSDRLLFCRSYYLVLSFETSDDPVDGIKEILLVDSLLVMSCSCEGSLVADIGDICSREARSMLCKEFKVEILSQFESPEVNGEDLFPLLEIRKLHMDLAVGSSCTHKSFVENVSTVGCCKNDHTGVSTETVHLSKKLVQSVFPLII